MAVGIENAESTGRERSLGNIHVDEQNNGEINSEKGLPVVR